MAVDGSSRPRTGLMRSLGSVLWLGALGGVAVGALRLSTLLSSGYTPMRLADTIFYYAVGFLLFACARLLSRGTWWTVPLFAATTLGVLAYGPAVGHGFNIVFAAGGLAMLVALVVVWRRGELS